MKIAVLSDVHGNMPALRTVAAHIGDWQPDVTVVNGDVVNRGPLSLDCWRFVRRKRHEDGWLMVSGNHEAFVLEWEEREPQKDDPEFEIYRSSCWTYQQLDGAAQELKELPEQLDLAAPDGSVARFTHASVRGNRDGIYPKTPDEELRKQIGPPPAVFCTAHTHRPLIRTVDETTVVNVGSAGTTFDGDPRASYAQLTWRPGRWDVTLIRLPYDREQTAQDFVTSGFMEGGGPLTEIFFHEWQTARSHLPYWARQYEEAVRAGEISLEASVRAFLADGGRRALLS